MYAYYKGELFSTHNVKGKFMIGSKIQKEGFEEYTDVLGRKHSDHFVKLLDITELDYLYELSYQVKLKNRWYNLHTALNHLAVTEEHYEITLSFLDRQEQKLAEEPVFERTDKFYYTKRLYRSDIEALKVIETPLGIFSDQGQKEKIFVGSELDDYLEGIMKEAV